MPHKWERDGERCEKCGAKDWMNIPYCIDDDVVSQDDTDEIQIETEDTND